MKELRTALETALKEAQGVPETERTAHLEVVVGRVKGALESLEWHVKEREKAVPSVAVGE